MHKNKNTERTYVYENQMENSHIQSRGSPYHGSRIRISHAKRHVVWTTLFLLMGISAYLVTMKRSDGLKSYDIPAVYWIQLIVNFIWPLIFFNLAIYGIALAWLILLIILVIYMIFQFHDITPAAGWLQVPYLLWLIFAGYLNAGIWLLN